MNTVIIILLLVLPTGEHKFFKGTFDSMSACTRELNSLIESTESHGIKAYGICEPSSSFVQGKPV